MPLFAAAQSSELKVMSYNIRLATPKDGTNAWMYRCGATLEMIEDQKPDVIGVQEALADQVRFVDEFTTNYDYVGVGRTDGKSKGEHMAIYWNKKTVKMLKWGTFWLSETPDTPSKGFGANYSRNATWGIFKHKPSGVTFYYINTHLDHQVANAQIEGMKLISQHFEKYRGVYPLFLTGDLNIKANNVALDVIESYMYNAREAAPASSTDFNTTYNGYVKNKDSIIDHIYCNREQYVVRYHTINEDYGVNFVSDHYPIYAIIKLK